MLDSLSVPRRPFDFEDYVDILRRNMRWLLAPAFAGLVIATLVAYLMDDTYVSNALIRVTPQQISPELVQNFTSQDVAERINGMSQTILSHNTLSSLITSYGLYKNDLKSEPMEDVIEKMHKAISIVPVGGSPMKEKFLPVMQVKFSYSDRYTAQKVCADLVSRFMNLSTQYVVESQQQANEFLNDEVDQAKRELSQLEQKVSEFRAQHAGRLPEETQTNVQEMNALDNRLSALTEAANRNSERRMLLENELRIAKDRLAAVHSPGNQKVQELDRQIAQQQTTIAAMRERYTEDYPDLQAAKDRLAFLKREREAGAQEKPQADDDTPVLTREGLEGKESMDRIQTQLKTNAMEEKQIQRDIGAVNTSLRNYQSRLEAVPAGEREYYELLRDRDLAKQRYIDLESKRAKSSVSIDMEKRKQGETLELLDAASLPTSPTAPKRAMILPMGTFIGLVVGLVIVGLREVKDTSLKNLKDARLYTQLSILGSIPLLENDIVVQRRKQVMWVGWATATIAGLAIMAGSMAHYYLTR
jgi:polysaccharide chain length determinant protein (PEP-CTERM system associated)